MPTPYQLHIAKDFTRHPGGRLKSDGPFSGELFRESLLHPRLISSPGGVSVYLDGTLGYPSSFLEEAFGGLVRDGFFAATLGMQLDLISSDKDLVAKIWGYIDEAAAESNSVLDQRGG